MDIVSDSILVLRTHADCDRIYNRVKELGLAISRDKFTSVVSRQSVGGGTRVLIDDVDYLVRTTPVEIFKYWLDKAFIVTESIE